MYRADNSQGTGDGMPSDPSGFYAKRMHEAQRSGFSGNLNDQQQRSLDELKKKLFDPTFPFAAEAKHELDGDRFFLRFLRATMKDKRGQRLFDSKEAITRLQKMYEWRKEYEVDELQKNIDEGKVR
jgi:hypothetical protein